MQHMSRTLPRMGAQFKQNPIWNVKPLRAVPMGRRCGIVNHLFFNERCHLPCLRQPPPQHHSFKVPLRPSW